jgi:hypothetical protein
MADTVLSRSQIWLLRHASNHLLDKALSMVFWASCCSGTTVATVDFYFAPLQNRSMPEAAEQLTLEDGSFVQLYRAQKWWFGEISSSVDRLLIRSPQGQEIDCIIFQQHDKPTVKFVRKQLTFAKLDTSGLINTDFAYGLEEPPREWAELVTKIRKRFDPS